MKIKDLYKKVKKLAKKDFFTMKISSNEKIVKAMAEYITTSWLQYIKIVFEDKSFLYIPKDEEELYYSEDYVVDTNISDEDIGKKEIVKYNFRNYFLQNKDDYQFVKRFYLWDILDIEGEVRFSDYIPKWWDEILSLGWSSFDKKRCDVNPKLIDIKEVKFK